MVQVKELNKLKEKVMAIQADLMGQLFEFENIDSKGDIETTKFKLFFYMEIEKFLKDIEVDRNFPHADRAFHEVKELVDSSPNIQQDWNQVVNTGNLIINQFKKEKADKMKLLPASKVVELANELFYQERLSTY